MDTRKNSAEHHRKTARKAVNSKSIELKLAPFRTESKPGSHRWLDRSWCSLFAAWFPGGATISLPCDGSFPAPRRTGLGVLHHPAPSLSLPPRDGIEIMENPGAGEHGANVRSKTLPRQRTTLAAPIEPLEQQAGGGIEIARQGTAVTADAVVLNVNARMPARTDAAA